MDQVALASTKQPRTRLVLPPCPNSQPNVVEVTVSELSAALKRTVEDAYGYVRVRGEISGYKGPHSSGHCYFALKDDRAKIDGVIWKMTFARMRMKPEEGMEVIVTGRLTTYPNRSSYQIVVETLEPAGLGALMALLGGAQAQAHRRRPVRRGAKAAPAVPARGDRRRHLADRRGDPRHPAPPRRPLSAPRHRLAGQGPGRRLRRAGRRRHPRLQRAPRRRPHPQARPADRRPRRRLAGGPVVVQRGDRGPRRGREHDPADLRGRPRDRRHPDRLRLRQARADADRRRRDGGAGARRPDRRADEQGAPRAVVLAARPESPPQRGALRRPRPAERAAADRRSSGSSSTRLPRGCRGRSAPTRRSITRSSPASPGGSRRSFCAATSSAAACGSTPARSGSAAR